MIDKIVGNCAEALAGVRDGAVVLVGGFGQVGHPMMLLAALAEHGARDLTIVCNNAGVGPGDDGIPRLMKLGRVSRVVCSFPRSSEVLTRLFAAGRIELEIVPQGTLVERMRAAGAGIGGFYTRTAAGTLLAHGKEERIIDGHPYILEQPLHGDLALVEAWNADRWGNLTYRQSGRNFNPVMATAAKLTVVQAHHIVGLGEIDPEAVVTPGIFVDRVVQAPATNKQGAMA
jgi:3-oxoadipate CoA-transferase alpha subunit